MTLPKGKILWAIAGAATLLLLMIVGVMWWFLTYGNIFKTSRLPRVSMQSTALVFQGMDAAAWQRTALLFPTLPALPSPVPVDGAVVVLPSKKLEWIVMDPLTHKPVGSAEAMALLQKPTQPVQREPLIADAPAEGTWLAVTPLLAPMPELQGRTPSLMRIDLSKQVAISWNGMALPARSHTSLAVPGATSQVFVADPSMLWKAVAGILPRDRVLVLETLLKTESDNLLPGISAREELLPLLSQSLTVVQRGSALLLFAEGERTLTAAAMDALHKRISDATPAIERLQAKTKEGFQVDVVTPAASATTTVRSAKNGWDIVTTKAGDTPLLLTASQGNQLIITADPALFESALGGVRTTQAVLAGGFLDPSLLSPLVTKLLPELPLYKVLGLLPKQSGALPWSLMQHDGMWMLNVGEGAL